MKKLLFAFLVSSAGTMAFSSPAIADHVSCSPEGVAAWMEALNEAHPDLRVSVKSGVNVLDAYEDLHALENFLDTGEMPTQPIQTLRCTRCVCSGCD